MDDKYNDFIENHGGIFVIIWLCGLVGLLAYSLKYQDADIIGAAVWTFGFGFWVIVFLVIPIFLRTCELLFIDKNQKKSQKI